jgi:hypothetical protein
MYIHTTDGRTAVLLPFCIAATVLPLYCCCAETPCRWHWWPSKCCCPRDVGSVPQAHYGCRNHRGTQDGGESKLLLLPPPLRGE